MVVSAGRGLDAARGTAPGTASPPPPWTVLAGSAEGDDGRTYTWSVSTAGALAASGAASRRCAGEPVTGVDVAGAALWLSGDDEAVVVVDAPHFGTELLDALQYGPAWLRARVFHPQLTQAEQAWLDELERRDAAEVVPRVVAALEATLGDPLRVEADRALQAAEIMLAEGYVISPRHLFSTHGQLFSAPAREMITDWLVEHAPD